MTQHNFRAEILLNHQQRKDTTDEYRQINGTKRREKGLVVYRIGKQI